MKASALFLFLFVFGFACAAQSAAAEGIAMLGAPKYGASFSHFDYADPNAPKGGVLHLGVVGTFDSLNPFIVRGTAPVGPAFGFDRPGAVYQSLLARSWDEPFSLYPLLAAKVEMSPDRQSVTFTLNAAARWQDGAPVTADDVLYSYQTLRDQGRPNHRTYYKKVLQAEKVGPLVVRFTFRPAPDGAFDREMPLIMGLMPILPQHDWQSRVFNETTLRPPVGSGPYRVATVVPGRLVVLKRDPAYWGRDLPAERGMNNFDEVHLDYYRDDSIALQAFKAGAFDIRRETDPTKWALAYESQALKDGRIKLARLPHKRTEAAYGFVLNTRRALFQDPVLRAAVQAAFDFGWINTTLFHGLYHPTESYFPNAELATDPHALPAGDEKTALESLGAAVDPALLRAPLALSATDGSEASLRAHLVQAALMLKKAGYVLKEGSLYAPHAQGPLAFEILLRDPAEEKIALNWARNLARLGIQARVHTVDSAQYQARLAGFDYDVTTARWYNSLSPGNEQAYFWSCAAARQPGSRNYPGICDPAIDKLVGLIPQSRTRDELVGRVRALDRLLLAGNYTVLMGYLGADLIAYWPAKARPPQGAAPLYGAVLESWAAPEKKKP